MNVRVECLYMAELNWSLLQAGIPLIFALQVSSQSAIDRSLQLRFSIPSTSESPEFLGVTTCNVSPEQVKANTDVAGILQPRINLRLRRLDAWHLEALESKAALRIACDLFDQEYSIDVYPPSYWLRVIRESKPGQTFGLGHGTLKLRRAVIEYRDGTVESSTQDVLVDWGKKDWAMPPLEAAVAAFVDPNDSYLRDEVERTLATMAGANFRAGVSDPSPMNIVGAYYRVLIEHSDIRFTDYLHELAPEVQAIRLFERDRVRGALCLDLAIVCCQLLEHYGKRPVFILTNWGRHAVVGVWTDPKQRFADGGPVCRDPSEMQRLVDTKLHILDHVLALKDVNLRQATLQSKWRDGLAVGFQHAVDIVAARGWSTAQQHDDQHLDNVRRKDAPQIHRNSRVSGRLDNHSAANITSSSSTYAIRPLLRPSGEAIWIPPYLESMRKEIVYSAEIGDRGRLDDPVSLFVPLSCESNGTVHTVLGAGADLGWLDEMLVQHPGRIALLANGGAGKSYICRRIADALADRWSTAPSDDTPIPLFFPLRLLTRSDDLLKAVARVAGLQGVDDLLGALRTRRFLLVLDALDESDFSLGATSAEKYEKLLKPLMELPKCSILLTARPALFPGTPESFLPGFTVAKLKGWESPQFHQYLDYCVLLGDILSYEDATHLWDAIYGSAGSQNLLDLAQTPLFARMLVVASKRILDGDPINNELDLYRVFTEECFVRRRADHPIALEAPSAAREATEEIALAMYLSQTHGLETEEITRELSYFLPEKGRNSYRQFLVYDVIVHGLLAPVDSQADERHYGFTHISLEHYFLAERLGREVFDNFDNTIDPPVCGPVSSIICPAVLGQSVVDFLAQLLMTKDYAAKGSLQALASLLACAADERDEAFSSKISSRPEGESFKAEIGCRNLWAIFLRAGGILPKADLSELDFNGADLSGAQLTDANLQGTNFRRCILEGTIFDKSRLWRANLRECDLTGASFIGADLESADLSHIHVQDYGNLPSFRLAVNLPTITFEGSDEEAVSIILSSLARYDLDPDETVQKWLERVRSGLRQKVMTSTGIRS